MHGPFVDRALRRQGAEIAVFPTPEAPRYTTEGALTWATTRRAVTRPTPDTEYLSDSARLDTFVLPQAT